MSNKERSILQSVIGQSVIGERGIAETDIRHRGIGEVPWAKVP